jgi:hypothetical protein
MDRFETEAACGVPGDATTIARIFAADFLADAANDPPWLNETLCRPGGQV